MATKPKRLPRLTRARRWLDTTVGIEPNPAEIRIDEIVSSSAAPADAKKRALAIRRRLDRRWLLQISALGSGTLAATTCALSSVPFERTLAVITIHMAGTLIRILEDHLKNGFDREARRLGWAIYLTGTAVGIRYLIQG